MSHSASFLATTYHRFPTESTAHNRSSPRFNPNTCEFVQRTHHLPLFSCTPPASAHSFQSFYDLLPFLLNIFLMIYSRPSVLLVAVLFRAVPYSTSWFKLWKRSITMSITSYALMYSWHYSTTFLSALPLSNSQSHNIPIKVFPYHPTFLLFSFLQQGDHTVAFSFYLHVSNSCTSLREQQFNYLLNFILFLSQNRENATEIKSLFVNRYLIFFSILKMFIYIYLK